MTSSNIEEQVHVYQEVFRVLLEACSRPGSIHKVMKRQNYQGNLLSETVEIARTLLDGEVSFYIAGEEKNTIEEVKLWSLATVKSVYKADFIFIPHQTKKHVVNEVLKQAKIGSLLYPNESATIVIECVGFGEGEGYSLRGPGIQSSVAMKLLEAEEWIAIREEKNQEYPLGIDIFCVSVEGEVIGLPRTTQITSTDERAE